MKILIVDDRAENRLILETKLRAAGYQVESASNGMEALRALRSTESQLVITDLMMPKMDGYQLTHAIKTDESLKDIPVLVYTATFTEAKDETLALNLGASGFIRKPATDEEFFGEIDRIVREAAQGGLVQRVPTGVELDYLREYSERLVHKLEKKVQELEDTTQRLRDLNATLELRVRAATAELTASNGELESFAYSVSHDLRSPLRSIQGYIGAILAGDPPLSAAEQREFLERTAALSVQAQNLVNDLLEYARLKSAELALAPVPLSRAVAGALNQIEPGLRARARIEVAELQGAVLAHEPSLVQAVYNLVANALKFTAQGVSPRVRISEELRKGTVRLSVRDQGIGIPPEHQVKIFRAFERLHGAGEYPGTGVGLAIVQRAIQKMGGSLGLESAPGQGSTFWIELPAAPASFD